MSQNIHNMQLVIQNKEQRISELEAQLEAERRLAFEIEEICAALSDNSGDDHDSLDGPPSDWNDDGDGDEYRVDGIAVWEH
eukprot:CAMPEP_0201575278 /NCGR_PEP_ID=MMETSP0190_2-20130828/20386_1 /ASSEMBLY_ACC=CAM_ASM_000263 /TAXON_ID=37353 /ORGANISM="Rosalina sp." /LENGTH=80 /DNA_ID=CAMNT_0048004699 /DNA_START=40 /DNA_END=282 /DNA_ORIENTATION=-